MLLTWLISTFEFQLFSLISLFQGVENVCAMEREENVGVRNGGLFTVFSFFFFFI